MRLEKLGWIMMMAVAGIFSVSCATVEAVQIPEGKSAVVDVYPGILWPERDTALTLDILGERSFDEVEIQSEYYSGTIEAFVYKDRNKQKRGVVEIPLPEGLEEGDWELELVLLKKGEVRGKASVVVPVRGALAARSFTEPRVGTPAAEAVLDQTSETVVTGGNSIRPLLDGTEALEAWTELLESAEKQINIATCIFVDKGVSSRLVQILMDKAAAGVEVNILASKYAVEGMSPFTPRKIKKAGVNMIPVGEWKGPKAVKSDKVSSEMDFSKGNIYGPAPEIPFFEPWKEEGKSVMVHYGLHQKMAIVDGRRAIAGGRNIQDCYYTYWEDFDLAVEGPVVDQMEKSFETLWAEFGGTMTNISETLEPSEVAGDQNMRFVDSRPWHGEYPAMEAICRSIDMAQDTIYTTSQYLALSERLRESIGRAADRGVDVRVVTNSLATSKDMFLGVWFYASMNHMRPLLERGVKLYEFYGDGNYDDGRTYMHIKELIIDAEWAAFGSCNLTMRSGYIDSELVLAVDDKEIISQQEADFHLRCTERGREITLKDLAAYEKKYGGRMRFARFMDKLS